MSILHDNQLKRSQDRGGRASSRMGRHFRRSGGMAGVAQTTSLTCVTTLVENISYNFFLFLFILIIRSGLHGSM